MYFSILDEISEIETIAFDRSIHEVDRLRRVYVPGSWRKRKGFATVRLADGFVTKDELHWYECHGLGKKEFKIRNFLD